MFDPIGGFERTKRFYLSYLETAFRIGDRRVAAARRALMLEPGILALDPIIEMVPRYVRWDNDLEDLIGPKGDGIVGTLDGAARTAFVELVLCGLFPGDPINGALGRRSQFRPYDHQIDMLAKGLIDGSPGIVTSGTGSGKTESFMLPIIGELAKEASTKWPDAAPIGSEWFDQRGQDFQLHRHAEDDRRPKAVRALVLYPMNALVEDQMVRLRRALDSDAARETMNRRLRGNRIFFGRYNGETPVTGFRNHPRLSGEQSWQDRYKSKRDELKQDLKEFARAEREVRQSDDDRLAADPKAEPNRYLFPAVLGDSNELVDRWNMQETPPDILVTNYSMLNALLVREVDASIMDKTRAWLMDHDDARFFLVMDELHLVRGSGGGEIAGLLRILLQRLGLADHRHRHKLRVLASSASLPVTGERREASLRYLWNLFGSAGTHATRSAIGAAVPADWASAVVTGHPETVEPPRPISDRAPLAAFATQLETSADGAIEPALLEAAVECLTGRRDASRSGLEEAAREAGRQLARTCAAGPVHATAAATEIFVQPDINALRGLTAMRALAELPTHRILEEHRPNKRALETSPAFRIHGFFRSIEGLFSSLRPSDDGIVWGTLSVERGEAFDPERHNGERLRRFEMLYCESCGDLFVGGRRGGSVDGRATSILPAPQDLEGLPEKSSSSRFEDASYQDYAVFWPSPSRPRNQDKAYLWLPAFLDPRSGIVKENQQHGWVAGYLLRRRLAAVVLDKHKRQAHERTTATPYCCPRCGTDYSPRYIAKNTRRREGRLSPLRSFRTGFGKTSQILATELVTFLKAQGGDGKLVAFSDSRQDAARLALDIEEQHQRDLRRELLVETATATIGPAPDPLSLAALQRRRAAAVEADDEDEIIDLSAEIKAMKQAIAVAGSQPSVALCDLMEFERGVQGNAVRPVLRRLIEIGANPEEGPDHGQLASRDWNWYFLPRNGGYEWRSGSLEGDIRAIRVARDKVMTDQSPDATDLLFSKTYFAFEETGLGWPSFFGRGAYDDDMSKKDVLLRMFADGYRVLPNRFMLREDAKPWQQFADSSQRFQALMRLFFNDPQKEFAEFLTWLGQRHDGKVDGRIEVAQLHLRLADMTKPYWRCENCGRVHLHPGLKRCTRCGEPFGAASGTIEQIRDNNYLAVRVDRGKRLDEKPFRVRCAELTGQSEAPSITLRRFKGIFVKTAGETADMFALRAKAEDVDLVSVTTTMEVGVDIGALEAVYQANMPPQRFNYQQRVGRAGRRGQAFATVMTVCRSRSHDIHYFKNPLLITGEAPPPPFITTGLVDIPSRLLRKVWLTAAFAKLRDKCDNAWAGDVVVPPDIHGEFVYCSEYFDDTRDWSTRVRKALEETIDLRTSTALLLSAAADINEGQLRETVDVDRLMAEVETLRTEFSLRRTGLASALAERGLFPLYGMPTRTRNLYVGVKGRRVGNTIQPEWDTINRDQDVAIHEFAPGSMLVRDKKRHLAIGFTGEMPPPSLNPTFKDVVPYDNWNRESFVLGFCKGCGNWEKDVAAPRECSSCGTEIEPDECRPCLSPAAYRTDFRPQDEETRSSGRRDMTLASVSRWKPTPSGNLRLLFEERSQIHKVNGGPLDDAGLPTGFSVAEWVDRTGVSWSSRGPQEKKRSVRLHNQAIETTFAQDYPGRWAPGDEVREESGWLVSSKVTNALHLTPVEVSPWLRIADVESSAFSTDRDRNLTSVRAAAITATQIVLLRAALDLDVAPEEFEALAPRSTGTSDAARPFLQIADTLVNGSGFCRHLQVDGRHAVGKAIDSILDISGSWPLSAILAGDHTKTCDQACYRCLQRYGNRSLHGLLDWRLGLAYLRAMRDPSFMCGLDGDYSAHELADWPSLAEAYADEIKAYLPGTQRKTISGLPAFSTDSTGSSWLVVVHPLWNRERAASRLSLPPQGLIDTFELARRPISAIEHLRR